MTRWPFASTLVSDLRDRAAVDPDVEDLVDALARVEDARAADHEVVGALLAGELCAQVGHHATSTTVSTGTGPLTSRS